MHGIYDIHDHELLVSFPGLLWTWKYVHRQLCAEPVNPIPPWYEFNPITGPQPEPTTTTTTTSTTTTTTTTTTSTTTSTTTPTITTTTTNEETSTSSTTDIGTDTSSAQVNTLSAPIALVSSGLVLSVMIVVLFRKLQN